MYRQLLTLKTGRSPRSFLASRFYSPFDVFNRKVACDVTHFAPKKVDDQKL